MKSTLLPLAVAIILALAATAPRAAIFKYVNEEGRTIFTDNPEEIPAAHREESLISNAGDTPSPVMAVEMTNNQIILPVTVSYQGREIEARFLLDTGATITIIGPALVDRLGIKPEQIDVGYAQVAGGGVLQVGHTRVDSMTAGPSSLDNLEVGILPCNGHDGILGMNFLTNFRYRVDHDRSIIHWGM